MMALAAKKKKLKSRDEMVADALPQVLSCILRPPPLLARHGSEFLQKVLWRPSSLKVYSVDLGCKVSKSIATSLVSSSVLSSALGAELAAAASLTSAAQAQALGLLALRIPLGIASRMAGNGPATARLVELITRYATSNAKAVAEMASMGPVAQVATIGVKGSIMGAIATAAVQESIAVAYYCHGGGTFDVLCHQTATIGISIASTVGGGTVGAAVGCLVMPGLGTAFGSLVGSYVGNLVPFYTRGNGYAHQTNEDPRRPSRKVKAIEVQPRTTRSFRGDTNDLGGGWLEVIDCSTESYFRFGSEPSSDSLALLREYSLQGCSSPSHSQASLRESNNTMCGFDGLMATPSSNRNLYSNKPVDTTKRINNSEHSPLATSASWSSYLNPFSYFRSANSTAKQSPEEPNDTGCSTFFVRPGEELPAPREDEMIIYFQPLEGAEEEHAISDFDCQVASKFPQATH